MWRWRLDTSHESEWKYGKIEIDKGWFVLNFGQPNNQSINSSIEQPNNQRNFTFNFPTKTTVYPK